MNQLISKLFITFLIGTSVATTGAAIVKLANADHINIQSQINDKSKEVTEQESEKENKKNQFMPSFSDDQEEAKTSTTPTTVAQAVLSISPPTSSASTLPPGTFTAATLATHNSPNDCYIAHNGNVYDVSHEPAWSGCRHHGAQGGIDITSFFPHPISYLANVPKVGTYQSAAVTSGGSAVSSDSVSQTSRHDKDDDDDEDEDERESFDD